MRFRRMEKLREKAVEGWEDNGGLCGEQWERAEKWMAVAWSYPEDDERGEKAAKIAERLWEEILVGEEEVEEVGYAGLL